MRMILNVNDVALISNRRVFVQDEARFFVGRALACEGELIKVAGFSFVHDLGSGQIVRKEEQRIRPCRSPPLATSSTSCPQPPMRTPLILKAERVKHSSSTGPGD